MPITPRRAMRSTPSSRPKMAISAGDAARTSAASPARVRATPFDEQQLVHAVAERAEQQQGERIAPREPWTLRPRHHREQRHRGERDAHAVVRERRDGGRAVLHHRVVDPPDEAHRHEEEIGDGEARQRALERRCGGQGVIVHQWSSAKLRGSARAVTAAGSERRGGLASGMHLTFALFADSANLSQEGKLNILGVFDAVQVAAFPTVHPRAHLVVRLKGSRADAGTHTVTLVWTNPGGNATLALQRRAERGRAAVARHRARHPAHRADRPAAGRARARTR